MKFIVIRNKLKVKQSILQSNKGFCLSACMSVCQWLNNFGTAGSIWLNFFCLSHGVVFIGLKNSGSGFSGNLEKPGF